MMDFIIAPLIVGIIVLGIYKLFELYARRRERLTLIEKLSEIGTLPVNSFSLPDYWNNKLTFGALKSGCLLMGVGLGLLIGFFICLASFPDYLNNARNWEYRNISSLVYGSCVFLFGGIGLITAFLTETKMKKKKKQ